MVRFSGDASSSDILGLSRTLDPLFRGQILKPSIRIGRLKPLGGLCRAVGPVFADVRGRMAPRRPPEP